MEVGNKVVSESNYKDLIEIYENTMTVKHIAEEFKTCKPKDAAAVNAINNMLRQKDDSLEVFRKNIETVINVKDNSAVAEI